MPGSQLRKARQPAAAAVDTRVVEVFRWTGSGCRTASGDDVPAAGDVIVRRALRGRIEVDEANHDAGTVGTLQLTIALPDHDQRDGQDDAVGRGPRTPSRGSTTPGLPRWRVVAGEIAQRVEQALADPNHPWTVRWPSMTEMAEQLGVERWTVVDAIHYLDKKGVLVKAWVPRSGGPTELWVPRMRALGFGSRPTLHGIAAEIVQRGVHGEWSVLPSQVKLAKHFHVSVKFIIQVTRLLAERGQAVKLRIDGRYRWRIIQPHEIRRVDPRLTAPAPRAVITDVLARIRAGEFRYRLPGDSAVHDRPFLSYIELREYYGVRAETIGKIRKDLHDLGWIVPSGRKQWRLADQVPPVDRTTHPAPRTQRIRKPLPCNVRARELADGLINRIRVGEFTGCPFPTQVEVLTAYHAGRRNVVAAFELLEREGWIEFREAPRGRDGRVAVLADPLPEQPERQDSRLAIPVADLGLTLGHANRAMFGGAAAVKPRSPQLNFSEAVGALGTRVRTIRASRRWSQQDVASRSRLGRSRISGIERGRENITLDTLYRLAAALETHWADLVDNRAAEVPEPHEMSAPFARQLAAFGNRAYQTRVIQRQPQHTLAARAGIAGRSVISVIEAGTQNITLETLARLAAGLGVHWADLLDDRRPDPPHSA